MGLTLRCVRWRDAATGEVRSGDIEVGDDGRIERLRVAGARPTIVGDTVDGQGRFAFPGLVDTHVHLCFEPSIHPEEWIEELTDDEMGDIVRTNARATLAAGVTAVRDLGSRGNSVRDYARAEDDGREIGPRVLCSGPAITRPGGHCFFVGDTVGSDGSELAAAVRSHVAAGDAWVKVMVTGGALTSTSHPDDLQFSGDELDRAVMVARGGQVRLAAHVLSTAGVEVAVHAGFDTIEHCVGATATQLDRMRQIGISMVPVLSPSAIQLEVDANGYSKHTERLRAIVDVLHDSVRQGVRAGVTILAGTDAGCPHVPHGTALVGEVELLESLGLDRGRALSAATDGAADAIGHDGGRLEVGSVGDILLLDNDPLVTLESLRNPSVVIRRGRVVIDR